MESLLKMLSPNSFNTNFWFHLAHSILLREAEKGSNFVASPLSLHMLLSLVAAGTTGKTLQRLLSYLLSQSVNDLNLYSSQIISGIRLVEGSKSLTEGPLLSFANGAWVEQSFGFKNSFENVVKEVYKSQG